MKLSLLLGGIALGSVLLLADTAVATPLDTTSDHAALTRRQLNPREKFNDFIGRLGFPSRQPPQVVSGPAIPDDTLMQRLVDHLAVWKPTRTPTQHPQADYLKQRIADRNAINLLDSSSGKYNKAIRIIIWRAEEITARLIEPQLKKWMPSLSSTPPPALVSSLSASSSSPPIASSLEALVVKLAGMLRRPRSEEFFKQREAAVRQLNVKFAPEAESSGPDSPMPPLLKEAAIALALQLHQERLREALVEELTALKADGVKRLAQLLLPVDQARAALMVQLAERLGMSLKISTQPPTSTPTPTPTLGSRFFGYFRGRQ